MLPYDRSLIIIPTYNEIANIARMVKTVFDLSADYSLLVIDDGSPDGTAAAVKEMQQHHSKLHLLERSGKLGLGTAYVAGFKWALERDFQFVFEMDCDFSHDPKDLSVLLEAATKSDLVIGSRYIDGIRIINWPFKRLLLSYLASIYARFMTGMKLMDTTGGFKCFTRRALEALDLDNIISTGYSFQLELNYKVWCKEMSITEVPIIFYERQDGVSKMNQSIIFEALFAVVLLRWKKIRGEL
ncbi:MAG: polyprenol monophosphomannose synthase [Bdellovibrionales bacterium]|nr:polyprenol monophosphomannose synthase [Bdellovibrionales bacterium]MBT3527139.1 polyprenol monophosphomannose synthase [Bdellovibrionales bacterium]MBT7668954.1 polyprenol monophosphomannose synthase [Bdellovibrionales bacterium]MBT7767276.1 polyprenol monophosphomannose synthase [Bdellovibrionales bacterium]